MKICLIILLLSLVNYVIITTIVDSILMGALHVRFSMKCRKKEFVITKTNRIDIQNGYVYPKGILKLLPQYGFWVKYCAGNITALKNEVSKGNPVIVMIRIQSDQNWLHYVPVVGYDEKYIFIAESLGEMVNCDEQYYNRKIAIREFKKLWNTSMLKMPFYRNTYIKVEL